jgi:hypothetical protein
VTITEDTLSVAGRKGKGLSSEEVAHYATEAGNAPHQAPNFLLTKVLHFLMSA